MKTVLSILAATTALSALVSLPALSADRGSHRSEDSVAGFVIPSLPDALSLIWISGDDDDDDDDDHDEGDDDDDDDDDCDDDDDGDECNAMRRPVPNGPIKPPANGLFGTGTPPTVQIN